MINRAGAKRKFTMKEKFTQGDWNCNHFNKINNDVQYVRNEHAEICTLYKGVEVNAANAHLIAAAPEMYIKLKGLIKTIDWLDEITHDNIELDCLSNEIKELLAKARGEK